MKTFFRLTLAAALMIGLTAVNAAAQATQTATVNVNANVNSKAKLTVAGAVTFADADPDTTPNLAAAALNITVKARTGATDDAVLAVKADGDLTSGSDTIGIDQLTWTVTGTGFSAGTMATSDVTLGTWTGSGNNSGTQTYALVNSWTYATGSYTATITYTLTVP